MYPYSNFMTIDKNMVSYNGKICLKQYIRNKPKKYGIKIFSKAVEGNLFLLDRCMLEK